MTLGILFLGTLSIRNFVIRNFVIRNSVIRNFAIRNFVPLPCGYFTLYQEIVVYRTRQWMVGSGPGLKHHVLVLLSHFDFGIPVAFTLVV